MSVRPSVESCDELDNQVGVLMVPLPTEIDDKLKRLRHIGRMMQAKKSSVVPWAIAMCMKPMSLFPREFLQATMHFMSNKV